VEWERIHAAGASNQRIYIPQKQVQEDITAVQGAVAAGLRIEFQVDHDLTGIVIGKKVRMDGWFDW
jgi:hypothetical protein